LLLLDEIHKYARWRNLLKGIYDTERSRCKILVTGSARLDYYRKGGDSLAGRYRYFRLHPFSLRELSFAPGIEPLTPRSAPIMRSRRRSSNGFSKRSSVKRVKPRPS